MTDSSLPPETMQALEQSLAAGRKIDAIKIYREATGQGLKEAKEFIDELVPVLKQQDPQKYAALNEQGGGCSAALVALIALPVAALWWLQHGG